jgi:hypothetical protein
MYCKACRGNIYVDKTTVEGTRFDLACLLCGWRKSVDAKTNPLAKVLYQELNRVR